MSTFAGNAYATGTAGQIPLMYSYAGGPSTGILHKPSTSSSSSSSSYESSAPAVQQAAQSVAQTTSKAAETVSDNSDDATEKTKTAMEKFEEWAGNLFDWIETVIARIEQKASHFYDKAQMYIERGLSSSSNYRNAETNLIEAIKLINDQIEYTQQGQVRYRQQASKAYEKGKKALNSKDDKKFHDAVKTLKEGGIIDITEYNENVRKALEEYQKWYEKSLDCKYAIMDLNSTLAEYQEQLYNLPLEQAKEKIEDLAAAMDVLNTKANIATSGGSSIANLAAVLGSSVSSAASQQKAAANQVAAKQKDAEAAKTAYTAADKEHKKTEKALTTAEKQVKKYGAKLGKTRLKQIANGEKISTKGLKGKVLTAAKKYNAAIAANEKAENVLETKKSYYSNAKSALNTANAAKKQIDAYYKTLKEQLDEIKKYEGKASYEYANYVAKKELENMESQYNVNLGALKQAEVNVTTATTDSKNAQASVKKKAESILNSSLAKKLTADQKADLKAGKMTNTGSVTDKKLLAELNEYGKLIQNAASAETGLKEATEALTEAQQNATTSAAELAAARTEYAQKTFENIKNYYDSLIAYEEKLNEHQEKFLDMKEVHGDYTTDEDYEERIANRKEEMEKMAESVKKLQAQLSENVAAGYIKEGSTEWNEMAGQIVDAQNAVEDLKISIEELKQQQIADFYIKQFDKVQEKINTFRDTIGVVKNIISDEMMYDYDTGKLTNMGMFSGYLSVMEQRAGAEEMHTYMKEIAQLKKDFAAGLFGQKEFDERMKEAQDGLRNSISSVTSAQKEIINIFVTSAEKECDAIIKVMDSYKDALRVKKEYSEYDENIRTQTRDINLLKQQRAALDALSDAQSAENRAKKAALDAELAEKQKELDKTTKDHIYEMKITGIEELQQTVKDNYDKYIYQLTGSLDEMAKAIDQMTKETAGNFGTAITQMNEILKKLGMYITLPDMGVDEMMKYSSGTQNADPGWARINEFGNELVISPSTGRTYMKMRAGDNVYPHNLTRNLWDIAKNHDAIMRSVNSRPIAIPSIKVTGASGDSQVSIHYDSLIKVEGNLDSVTGAQVIDILNRQFPKMYDGFVQQTIKDARKRGLK